MTDPIADMLTQIRNALMVGATEVVLSYSKFKSNLADVLVRQGLLESAGEQPKGNQKQLVLKLKYQDGKPIIGGLKRLSTPGQRVYAKSSEIPRTQNGYGVTIISTSKGLLTDQQARKQGLGGEVICQIW